jgi:hypothetical protein
VNPSTVGFPAQSFFSGKTQDEIPGFTGGWSSGVTEIGEQTFDGGIYGKNTFGKTAKAPAFTDNFTKIIKTHSVKAGFYWDTQENLQSNSNGPPNPYSGIFDVENWSSASTYNMTLDRLMGRNYSYTEQSTVPTPDVEWHQWSIWGQDSWKATPKLTINLGLRADHEGQWYDKLGGAQVWDQATYVNTANPPANTGIVWNGTGSPAGGSAVPVSGWGSQLFTYNPRLGAAYDVFGTGKTVVRGGFGTYRYQISENDGGNAMNGPLGVYSTTTTAINGFYGYSIANNTVSNGPGAGTTTFNVPKANNQTGSGNSISADKLGDNNVPYASTWSFGVAQALPGHTVAQASYVGSGSHDQYESGNNDINQVPYGAFFQPDPKTGVIENTNPITGTGQSTNDYRPMSNYADVELLTHGGYANYHSLQVAAQKQSGNLYMFTNFTFGKVLGTRDGDSSNGNGNGSLVQPFAPFSQNYGQLAYDHTKTFNLSFSYKLPKPIHNNLILGEVVNGWQLSNYTTYEDGSPLQESSGGALNAGTNQLKNSAGVVQQTFTMPDGLQTQSIGTNTWFGTSRGPNMMPVLTCDPRKFIKTYVSQHFNPNCFAAQMPPTASSFGQEGQFIWPYIRNPGYFGSDLAIFKAFRITDSQRAELRFSATNWLNHPNAQFGQNGNGDETLTFTGVSTGAGLSQNVNASTTGAPSTKSGYRWMQFAAKYYF